MWLRSTLKTAGNSFWVRLCGPFFTSCPRRREGVVGVRVTIT